VIGHGWKVPSAVRAARVTQEPRLHLYLAPTSLRPPTLPRYELLIRQQSFILRQQPVRQRPDASRAGLTTTRFLQRVSLGAAGTATLIGVAAVARAMLAPQSAVGP